MQQQASPPATSRVKKLLAKITNFGGTDLAHTYAVAYPVNRSKEPPSPDDAVTFTMTAYHGGGIGMYRGLRVNLFDVHRTPKGWRASIARPVRTPRKRRRRGWNSKQAEGALA